MANVSIFIAYQEILENGNLKVAGNVQIQGQTPGNSLAWEIEHNWVGSVVTLNNACVLAGVAVALANGFVVNGFDQKLLFCGASLG